MDNFAYELVLLLLPALRTEPIRRYSFPTTAL